jgi:hydrogenase maturation protease
VEAVGLPVGTRVKLRPRPGGDVMDVALAGRSAVVEDVKTDMEGRVLIGVSVDDDPGRDLGEFGHRFFFSPEEVAPLRVLVAGIGNVFLGDDGFGVELAQRVGGVDFGIRGMDLAYALADYDVAIFLDATPRGGTPGTLYVIEPELSELPLDVDAHAMHPVSVLALAKTLGDELPRTLVLGCEPGAVEEFTTLSEPVRAALPEAERLLRELVDEVLMRKETA